jgi:unsaturated rhamnogalacturonyl hydrolase
MKKIISFIFIVCFFLGCITSSHHSQGDNDKKVFKKKYIKETMEKVTEWQLANPKHKLNGWHNGAFYAGVYAAWETTGSKNIYRALLDMGKTNNWEPGMRWYHADDIAICQTYVDLYRIEKKEEMIQPFKDTLALLMNNPYPHPSAVKVVKWWWCDALFMGPPALVKLGITLEEDIYLKYNDKLFQECYDLLYDKDEHLFARDLNYVIKGNSHNRFEANGKKIFWSRGNGWVMGGLVRILQELPSDYPQRPFYENLFQEMSARIADLQQADGLWRASLLDPESYPGGEVSGSGFNCYALTWGINNGLLDKGKYLPVVKNAWISLNKCVKEDGMVGWVQPVGASPRLNFNEDSWEVYGTGAFLLAASEVIRL